MDLQKLLIDVCKRAGLTRIPKLTECKGLTAHTMLNKIRIGRGLRSYLTQGEMEGVIAHEVHHAKKFIKYILIIGTGELLFASAVLGVELISFLTLVREFPMLILYIPPTIFQAIVVISIILSCLWFQRLASKTKELRADRFAASIVGVKLFANALRKVYSIPSKPKLRSRIWGWLSPHPPLDQRLKAIRNLKS
jgi:Zn-dependent protease with chaperone function